MMADRESEEASPIRATFLMSVTRGSLRVLGRSVWPGSDFGLAGVRLCFWFFIPVEEQRTKSDLAPRSSGKENHLKCETFHRNPAGNQPRPAKPGQQPEASLAWGAGDRHREA